MAAGIMVDLMGHAGTGLILEHPTGITYVTQAGGTYCLHPSCEGIFVSWFNDVELHQLGDIVWGVDPFPRTGVLTWTNSD